MSSPHNQRYKEAGVDIDAGAGLVHRISPFAKASHRPGVLGGLGGFGALFDLKEAGHADSILVTSTDGVGTKLKLAHQLNAHDTIGIDLVAMCVNDILVQGAEPLFFLDYFATGKLDVDTASRVIAGIAEGCKQAGCALVGGETAEMPGMYEDSSYDLAGFAVGAVKRGHVLPRSDLRVGDQIIGIASSGLHSNGYSLVRKIIADGGFKLDAPAPFSTDHATLGEALLAPTLIYVAALLPLLRGGFIKALSHITGGGLTENIPRVLPDAVSADLKADALTLPPLFEWLKTAAQMDDADMRRTFNCGIGMVAITQAAQGAYVLRQLEEAGLSARIIGSVVERGSGNAVRYV